MYTHTPACSYTLTNTHNIARIAVYLTPVYALRNILLLLLSENVVIEEFLQLLVRVVDAQLWSTCHARAHARARARAHTYTSPQTTLPTQTRPQHSHLLKGILRKKFKTEYVQYANEALVLSRLESETPAPKWRVKSREEQSEAGAWSRVDLANEPVEQKTICGLGKGVA